MTTLFGIKNCDTIKKARRWLEEQGHEYHFHDVRADGLTDAVIDRWLEQVSWEILLNKRGTTWRILSPETQDSVSKETIVALFKEHPTLIKRPVLERDGSVTVGFKADNYEKIFA